MRTPLRGRPRSTTGSVDDLARRRPRPATRPSCMTSRRSDSRITAAMMCSTNIDRQPVARAARAAARSSARARPAPGRRAPRRAAAPAAAAPGRGPVPAASAPPSGGCGGGASRHGSSPTRSMTSVAHAGRAARRERCLRMAAIATFSSTVMLPNGRMSWNVRTMPGAGTGRRASPVMSVPSNTTRPVSGVARPRAR